MPDTKQLLRETRDRIAPPSDVVGSLERRRYRKERDQRIRAGVLGLAIAIAVGWLSVNAIRSTPPIPADPPTPKQLGAGEVLTVMNGVGSSTDGLVARDADSGEVRMIVAKALLPDRADGITSAAWSPDRRWVAFRAGGLWAADTIGGDPRQLTADLGWSPWAWSPTEDQLVVVLGREVTLIDAATGRETDLGTTVGPEDSEGYAVHTLVWSPDGTRIAYDGGWGSVYSIDVESGKQTLLVRRPAGSGEIKDIDWSPDGAHLAISYLDVSYIASHKAELGPISYKATALYLANADGSDLRLMDRIVASQWPVWIPRLSVGTAWSPDGTRLAYTNFSGPDHRELQVWTDSVDGSAPSLVASRCCVADGGGAVWSPDGSRIAFETEPPGDVAHHYLVVNADGTGEPGEIDEVMYRSWLGGSYFCYCYG